ncbi:MAG: hypothetical protein AAF193_11015, partial [Bacteroidota bacterium]
MSGLEFIATNPSGCLTIEVTPDGSVSCDSGSQTEWDYDVSCGAGGPEFVYEWSPTDGLSDPNIATPFVTSLNGSTEYTLTAYPLGSPDCASTDVMTVNPAFDFNMDFQLPSCNGNDAVITVFVDENSGPGPWDIEFIENGGNPEMSQSTGGTTTFDNLLPGDYTVTIASGGCSYTQDFVIDGPPALVFETSPDIEICLGGTTTLEAFSVDDDDQSWTFTWDNGLGTGSAIEVSPTETTTYTVFATDDFNCDASPLEVTVSVLPALSVEMTAPQLLCAGADALLEVTSSTGGNGGPYQYEWLFNGNSIGNGDTYTHQEGVTGEYCVLITDGCETPAATACQEVQIEQSIPVVFDADTTIGCFPAEINFANLVDSVLID